jgi:hypothetical protein
MTSNLKLVAFHFVSFEKKGLRFRLNTLSLDEICTVVHCLNHSEFSLLPETSCRDPLRLAGPLFHRTGKASFAKPSQFGQTRNRLGHALPHGKLL